MFIDKNIMYMSVFVLIIYIIYFRVIFKRIPNIKGVSSVSMSSFGFFTCIYFLYSLIEGVKSLGDYEGYKNILFFGAIVICWVSFEILIKNFEKQKNKSKKVF